MAAKRRTTVQGLAGKQLVKWIEDAFEIADHQRPLLNAAAMQEDRAAAFRDVIEKEGCITTDRFGQPHEHPAVAGERQAVNTLRLLLRELGASAVDDEADARPPRIAGRYVQEG
jgi:phage terminase small subunit